MSWRPSYTESEAREAIQQASTWQDVTSALRLAYHGKNLNTVRKWADRWGISYAHLPVGDRAGNRRRRKYTEAEAREAIARSRSWSEALRRLGYCHTGGNPAILKERAADWGIPTDHFDPYASSRGSRPKIPLDQVLVEGSTYSRACLKRRLYESGLREPRCALCGQGETWRGKRIGLILDHINGVRDDNRLENLRIVCPNCAATLDTHCGRKLANPKVKRACRQCAKGFRPRYKDHRYCSPACWHRERAAQVAKLRGVPKPDLRKVERPPFEQLMTEITEFGYLAVGRRYGVSDNAVRKWVRQYERERALAGGRDPEVVEIPRRTWPNRRNREAA